MKKVHFAGAGLAGAVLLLSGCVGVPVGPGYSGGSYGAYDGYGGYGGYGAYPAPYYADPGPVVVPPSVYIQGGTSYYGRPRYRDHDDDWRGEGRRPPPGYYGRPGYAAPPVAGRPGYPMPPPVAPSGRPGGPAGIPLPFPGRLPPVQGSVMPDRFFSPPASPPVDRP